MLPPLLVRRLGSIAPVFLLALFAGTLAGCGPDEEPPGASGTAERAADQTPRRGGTLVIASLADMDTVNDAISSGSRAFSDVNYRLFLHLLEEQPDFTEHPPTFAPAIAESYEFSDDHLTLTFHLRDDLVWSDGEPITAEDVRFTWQAQTDPSILWGGAYMKEAIRDVEVVDPHTVRYHFTRVSPTQLVEANEGPILPRHAWGKLPFSEWRENADFFRDNLVVSGPYRLESWTPQQEIVLVRNERYHEAELPYIDRVVFRIIPDTSNQVTQLLAGSIDFVEQIPIEDVPRVQASPRVRVNPFWHRLYTYVAWNFERPFFEAPELRRALTHAIDRQAIVDTLWGEWARQADSPIVSNVWAHNDELEPLDYDPERAKELLASEGWTDTDGDGVIDKDGVPFRFDLVTNQGNQSRIDAVVMIQEFLREVGIDAQPRILEFNVLQSRLNERNFDAALGGWGMPTTLDLRYAFHTDSIEDNVNFMGYSNPEVDRLIDQMARVPTLEEAADLLDRLQLLIHQDQPMTFLWESQRINGVNRRVENVQSNLLSSFFDLEEWWLAE